MAREMKKCAKGCLILGWVVACVFGTLLGCLWFNPSIAINAASIYYFSKAVPYLGMQWNWQGPMQVSVENVSWWEKKILIDAEEVCFKSEAHHSTCVEDFKLEARLGILEGASIFQIRAFSFEEKTKNKPLHFAGSLQHDGMLVRMVCDISGNDVPLHIESVIDFPYLQLVATDKTQDASLYLMAELPKKFPYQWNGILLQRIHGHAEHFENWVNALADSDFAIPSPVNALKGSLNFHSQYLTLVKAKQLRFPISFATDLSGEEQEVKLHGAGFIEVGIEGASPRLDLLVKLDKFKLIRPNFHEQDFRFFPDSRILASHEPKRLHAFHPMSRIRIESPIHTYHLDLAGDIWEPHVNLTSLPNLAPEDAWNMLLFGQKAKVEEVSVLPAVVQNLSLQVDEDEEGTTTVGLEHKLSPSWSIKASVEGVDDPSDADASAVLEWSQRY